MIRYLVHQDGRTEAAGRFDSAWLAPGSSVTVWADVVEPTEADGRVLREGFGLHEIAIEAAFQHETNPKVESYDGFLYIVLHGINFHSVEHVFDTHETDFFLSPRFLVTVHDGQRRSIAHVSDLCSRSGHVQAEGPVALLHRIVDAMVDHYRPEVDELEGRLDELEKAVIQHTSDQLTGDILAIKRDISGLRRIVVPQRDVISRLARREFEVISQEMAYRFRDLADQLSRMAEDAIIFQDRVTGILDAHLASVSNRLAAVSKLLAIIATLFGPLTVITGLFGMNVPIPSLLGDPAMQFWEILGVMALGCAGMFLWFRRIGWL